MKQLLLVFTFSASFCSYAGGPFSSLKADSVVMIDYDAGKRKETSLLDSNGHFNTHISILKRIKLDSAIAETLNTKIESKSAYGATEAACFEPHLGILYYKGGNIIANIDICVECNRLQPSIAIPAQMQGRHGPGEGIFYTSEGMSKSLRKYLKKLLAQYNFSHLPGISTLFD